MAKREFGSQAPPKYKTPEEMQAKAMEYFNNLPVIDRHVKMDTKKVKAATITGLVLHLGFCSRQSFYDYEKVPQFSYTIKKLRTFIMHEYEKMLHSGDSTPAMYMLKQFGMTADQQIDHTTNGKDMSIPPVTWVENKKED